MPRLYLAMPPLEDPAAFVEKLAAALDATDVAAVLVRLADAEQRALIERVRIMAPTIQDRGIALLLDGHAAVVAQAGADGAHLDGIEAFDAAVSGLKPDRIAGCSGLRSRHDAMLAGERGADYVMFGEPDADGRRPAFPAIVERVAWWADVSVLPCVGWAANLDEVGALAAAGADFIALDALNWVDPAEAAARLHAATARLTVPEPVP